MEEERVEDPFERFREELVKAKPTSSPVKRRFSVLKDAKISSYSTVPKLITAFLDENKAFVIYDGSKTYITPFPGLGYLSNFSPICLRRDVFE